MINLEEMGEDFSLSDMPKTSSKDHSEMIDVETTSPAFGSSDGLCMPAKKRTPSECSHKVIEKRRRDRINKCLADLAHIVPKAQGTGKLEKAEVLELTVEYIKKLQKTSSSPTIDDPENQSSSTEKEQPTACTKRELQSYSKGYSDCKNEVLHFMITVEATDPQLPCFQRLMAHLRNNCRLLVDFENDKKGNNSKLDSASTLKQRSHNKRMFNSETDSPLKAKRTRNKPGSPLDSALPPGNDDPKPPPSMSKMTLEDKMKAVFKNGNDGSSSPYNGNGGINRNGSNGDKGNPSNSCYPNLLPFPNHGYPPSYGFPQYALFPAGTHYVPVPINPGLPGNNLGGPIFPGPIVAPGFGYMGSAMSGMSPGFSLGGFSNILGGTAPPSYGSMEGLSACKGAEGLPAHLAKEKTKERNRDRVQDSSGSSENGSSGDEYNFSTTSSSNLSEVGIQTDQPNDHSDYYSAGSR